jgi:hypothetical protein
LTRQLINIADLRRLAKRRLPRAVFDYIDGGADDKTLRNREKIISACRSLIGNCRDRLLESSF